jgi:crotonobetainyl-CoA:carnitine CoA-transferase CaiB-like acyl-CoA transferase
VLECQAGAHLAAACLAARQAGLPREGGQIVDIALADVLAAYVAVNCRFYIHHGMQWARAGRRASNSGGAYPFVILPCKDGDVCLSGRTRPERERFVQAMGSPRWAKEPRYTKLRAMGQQYPEEVDALILPWLRDRTKAEIAAIAHEYQLTIAPLRHFDEILATPQLAERGFLKPWSDGGTTLRGPGLPFHAIARRGSGPDFAGQLLATVAPTRPRSNSKPLAGLRVLDFG